MKKENDPNLLMRCRDVIEQLHGEIEEERRSRVQLEQALQ